MHAQGLQTAADLTAAAHAPQKVRSIRKNLAFKTLVTARFAAERWNCPD